MRRREYPYFYKNDPPNERMSRLVLYVDDDDYTVAVLHEFAGVRKTCIWTIPTFDYHKRRSMSEYLRHVDPQFICNRLIGGRCVNLPGEYTTRLERDIIESLKQFRESEL